MEVKIAQSLAWDQPQERRLYLEVSALGTEPFLDKVLGVSAKAEHEIPLGLQLVDGLNGLMDRSLNNYRQICRLCLCIHTHIYSNMLMIFSICIF